MTSIIRTRLGIFLLLAAPGLASTFSATSGTAIITNSYGGPEGSTFTLTGPQLTLSAGGGSVPGYSVLQTLGNPFSLTLNLLISDNGFEGGSAVAGGVSYPSLAFSNSNTLVITSVTSILLTAGQLTVTTPATLSGTLGACATQSVCVNGSGIPAFPFDVSIAPIAGLLTVTYANYNPPFATQYALTKATFAPVPEPGTWFAGLCCLIAAAGIKLSRARGVAEHRKLEGSDYRSCKG